MLKKLVNFVDQKIALVTLLLPFVFFYFNSLIINAYFDYFLIKYSMTNSFAITFQSITNILFMVVYTISCLLIYRYFLNLYKLFGEKQGDININKRKGKIQWSSLPIKSYIYSYLVLCLINSMFFYFIIRLDTNFLVYHILILTNSLLFTLIEFITIGLLILLRAKDFFKYESNDEKNTLQPIAILIVILLFLGGTYYLFSKIGRDLAANKFEFYIINNEYAAISIENNNAIVVKVDIDGENITLNLKHQKIMILDNYELKYEKYKKENINYNREE